jgi:hypothetical protein
LLTHDEDTNYYIRLRNGGSQKCKLPALEFGHGAASCRQLRAMQFLVGMMFQHSQRSQFDHFVMAAALAPPLLHTQSFTEVPNDIGPD